jgi:hypothetical protein
MNKNPVFVNQILGTGISLLILALLLVNTEVVSADSENPGVYSPDSEPFGLSYKEWTTKWWQWFLEIPGDQSPFGDTTGTKCGLMQNGSVWFLVGSEGPVQRNCTVPADKAILIPIINTECSYAEPPNPKNKEELTKCAIDGQKGAVISASVDNRLINDPMKYRITTDIFNVTYGVPPVFPLNTNSTTAVNSQAVSDGWYLFLEPMSKGQHDVKVSASIVPAPGSIETALIEATYHLMIK